MKFLIETESELDEYSILGALIDFFPKDEFAVTGISDLTYDNWCKSVSECTEDEVNCAECSSASVKETVTKQIELVEE